MERARKEIGNVSCRGRRMLKRCTSAQILRPSWLTVGLLLDAGSALPTGGQVMFRPQPLHQLPRLELPSHVLSGSVSCLEPPPLSILGRRESYLSLARLPFTVCSSLPRPGLS